MWICCRSRAQVDSVSEAFFVSSHSSATAKNVLVLASDSARRFAPGSIPSAISRRASSRFSRARFKDTSGYVVCAKVQQLLYPTHPISKAPQPSASGRDQHEKAAFVEQLVGLLSRLSAANPHFREYRHGYRVPNLKFSGYPSRIPHPMLRCPRTAPNACGP